MVGSREAGNLLPGASVTLLGVAKGQEALGFSSGVTSPFP